MRTVVVLVGLLVAMAGCSEKKGSDGPMDPVDTGQPDGNATLANDTLPLPLVNITMVGVPFDLDATGCTEILGIFSVDIAKAEALVPDSYTILGDATGRATAFSGLKECADVTMDGVSIGPASTVDFGVFVDKGEPGVFHYYQTWWYTDNPELLAGLVGMGWNTGLSDDTLMGGPGTPGTVGATIMGPMNEYNMAGSLGPSAPGGTNEAVGWYAGPLGTVTIAKTLAGTAMTVGQVTLEGTGPAADLIGDGATGGALWNEYDMSGRVDFAA